MTPDEMKGQHGACPTVKIKSGDSVAIINESDFNPDVHELADGQKDDAGKGKKKHA